MVTLAYAAKTWQVKDFGAYSLAVLEPFKLGYKLGVLDLADEGEGPPYHGEAWACGGLAEAF